MTKATKPKIVKQPEPHDSRFTLVNRTLVGKPKIDERPEQHYMGIRTQTPFKGMFTVVDKHLFKELRAWLKQEGIEPAGSPILRYHVINMEGEMDIEVGIPVAEALPGNGRVRLGVLPAGRYASLIYINNGYTGNGALTRWGIENGLAFDQWADPKGTAFKSRYEAYLTDPKIQPLKTKWEVEVAIKLAD
ncbi:MAG: GyrI-like domain-containing protein [Anaerolineae bacterium]|nr:GyrI-like domain-containing protein [Anaerolineae bacterium]